MRGTTTGNGPQMPSVLPRVGRSVLLRIPCLRRCLIARSLPAVELFVSPWLPGAGVRHFAYLLPVLRTLMSQPSCVIVVPLPATCNHAGTGAATKGTGSSPSTGEARPAPHVMCLRPCMFLLFAIQSRMPACATPSFVPTNWLGLNLQRWSYLACSFVGSLTFACPRRNQRTLLCGPFLV